MKNYKIGPKGKFGRSGQSGPTKEAGHIDSIMGRETHPAGLRVRGRDAAGQGTIKTHKRTSR